jgi:phage-related protein
VIVNPQGRVLESLKGDLKPNPQLSLSDLKVSSEFTVDSQPYVVPDQIAKISSEKLLLLLDRRGSGFRLHGVHFGSFVEGSETISVAWFAHGKAYTTSQINNPGPVRVAPFGDEKTFRQRLVNILNTQKALRNATKTPLKKRAQALATFMKTHTHWKEIYQAREETLKALSRCGQSAITVFPALFRDESLGYSYNDVARSFIEAVGIKSAPAFTAIVRQELVFWRKTALTIPVGTLNNAASKGYSHQQYQRLQTHYNRLQAALNGLRHFRYTPCKNAVTQTHALWLSLPQLEARRRGPIRASCETILKRLG